MHSEEQELIVHLLFSNYEVGFVFDAIASPRRFLLLAKF